MKILFFMKHRGSVRSFESTVHLLLERGHRVHLALESHSKGDHAHQVTVAEALFAGHPRFSMSAVPDVPTDGWATLGTTLREAIDYLRYLDPRYGDAPKLRLRAQRRAPGWIRRLAGQPLLRTPAGRKVLDRALRFAHGAIRANPSIGSFILRDKPNIVLVTPLVDFGSPQTEYLRAARELGIRSGFCVRSWDNLTNKGLIQEIPDVVIVWNEALKREAVALHGVPASRVVVTGAQAYDHWFDWAPSTPRDQFCARVGLPVDRPYLLYACSSGFIAPDEARFVRDWLRRLRAYPDATLREAGVLIRPHPLNAAQWRDVDLRDLGPVAIWPREGAAVVDDRTKSEYYDSIHHGAAVIGVNTSALIESAIVGRPVHTLMTPELRETQEGTLHFRHLLHVEGGMLHVAKSFEEHAAQLRAALASEGRTDERAHRFLEAFVRPHGLDVPATPRVVAAIEAACARRARPRADSPLHGLARLAMTPLADYAERRRTAPTSRSKRRPAAEELAAVSPAGVPRAVADR